MAEIARSSELSLGEEWEFFGERSGLKTQGLIELERLNLPGVQVLRGVSVGVSYFKEFLEHNSLDGDASWRELRYAKLPKSLIHLNKSILSSVYPGQPLVVRSSEAGEEAGTGIYESEFFVPTGKMEEDVGRLKNSEQIVYSSFGFEDARLIRGSREESEWGMGMLIQPLLGRRFGKHFMPEVSGVLTVVNGEPAMRLVIGMGTGAVGKRKYPDVLVLKRDQVDANEAATVLEQLRHADAMNIETNELETIPVTEEMIVAAESQQEKLASLLSVWRDFYDKREPFYWEFVLTEAEEYAVVVQSNEESLDEVVVGELGPAEGKVLCESEDVVNVGKVEGRGVIMVGYEGSYDPRELAYLKQINQMSEGFLLIVPDKSFTRLADERQIQYSHFKRASVLVEEQIDRNEGQGNGVRLASIDHTQGVGGRHFTELCKRTDILFQGVLRLPTDFSFEEILGEPSEMISETIAVWDVPFKAVNTNREGRVEILGEAAERVYKKRDFDEWGDEVYSVACFTEKHEGTKSKVATSFFEVLDYLVKSIRVSGFEFDAFSRVEALSPKQVQVLSSSVGIVREHLYYLESYLDFEHFAGMAGEEVSEEEKVFPLEGFLVELKEKLEKRLENG